MTDRFDRFTQKIAVRLSALRLNGGAPRAALARMSPENRAVGVAVAGVMAGSIGLAIFNPLAGDGSSAEKPVQAVAAVVHEDAAAGSDKALSATDLARKEGYKVAPREVKAAEVIELAKTQIGTSEGRNGVTKYGKWYASTPQAKATAVRDGGGSVSAYTNAEWCDMFLSWLSSQTGVKNMGWDAYTVQHASWFKETGRWGDTAKPGALAFFDWKKGSSIGGIDHVALVVKDNGDGTVTTIDGNADNAVREKTRAKSSVVGYGYPDYDKA